MANLESAYSFPTGIVEILPLPIKAAAAPASTDIKFPLGQVWLDTTNGLSYILAKKASGSATWNAMAPGASDVDTISGDSGGNRSPTAGNIVMTGGTNITTAGATNVITFNLDAAITVATSVTCPLYTAAGGVDVDITAPSGQDVVIKLGDAAGANKLSVTDDADVEQFAVDSNGGLTMGAVTFTGLLTASASATISTAGTALNLGSDNSGDAVNLGVGTVARAVGIADSAAAHTITIGSITGAASLDLLAGTGNFTLDGAATTTMTIGTTLTSGTISIGGTAQTGTMTLGDSSGTNIVQIGSGEGATTVNVAGGATAAKVVNIATGAVANVVTIGTASGAGQLDLLCGTGNFSLDGAATSTYAVGASTTSGTITIGGTAQTGNLVMGTSSGTMNLNLGVGTGATTVNIATGGTGANAVNIGSGAIDNVVTIGSASAASSLDLLVGTGNYTLNGAATSTYTVGASTTSGTITIGGTAQTGTMTLGDSSGTNIVQIGSGEGATTVNIAGGATSAKAVNIADGAVANVVTIGTATGAASLTLIAGTGDITVTGTVKEIDAEFLAASGDDITFSMSPTTGSAADTGVAASGSTGDLNLLSCEQGFMMEQFVLGGGQTIIKPVMNGNGLLISGDLTATEGFEYNLGAARTNSRSAFVVNTALAFFLEVELFVADMTGGDPYMIGFRKSEANNATFANYTDYCAIGLNQATSSTQVVILDELNSTGQTATNTTDNWGGDGTSQTLKVLVSSAGVVTFEVGGSAASAAPTYTFDSGDVVVPFIHLIHGATSPGAVNIVSWKCGFQA